MFIIFKRESKPFQTKYKHRSQKEKTLNYISAPSLPPSAVHSSKHLHDEDLTLEVSHHELHMVENTKDSTYKQILEQMS